MEINVHRKQTVRERLRKRIVKAKDNCALLLLKLPKVIVSKTNKPIHESNVRGAIRYYIQKINAERPDKQFEWFTPHCLRHTFVTKCMPGA